jgi:hypothetical protein
MLDEVEFAVVAALYDSAIRSGKAPPGKVGKAAIEALFQPVCTAYERITGVREEHAAAVMHHRLSVYGPPCAQCGKPLRTPKAAHCAACGATR